MPSAEVDVSLRLLDVVRLERARSVVASVAYQKTAAGVPVTPAEVARAETDVLRWAPHDPPRRCTDGTTNCLPITPSSNYLVRIHRPREEILDGTWSFQEARLSG